MYSEILEQCKNQQNIQRITYWNRKNGRSVTYGFPVFYNESCIPMNFDPWSGKWIRESLRNWCFFKFKKLPKNFAELRNASELQDVKWLFDKFMSDQKLHCYGRYCTCLESCTRFGQRGDSPIIEICNIRVVGVLNKQKYGGWTDDKIDLFFKRNGYQGLEEWEFSGWTPMNYCPFCGAKLPTSLEKELIEVLKNEYGLTSWEDYEKAPQEFHRDEWWRKRGL